MSGDDRSEGLLRIAITGIGLWLPGFPDAAAWRGGTADAERPAPQGKALGRVNRRRASPLARALSDASQEALTGAGVDPSTLPAIVGSSIGEAATMIGLLDQMFRTHEPVSPAAFTVSVHNSASGMISIGHGNRGYATSMAADYDTPAMALLEAIGLVAATGGPVLVACADEAAPTGLLEDAELWDMLAVAVVVAPADAPDALATVAIAAPDPVDGRADGIEPADVSVELARNPQVGLLDLVTAVQHGRSGRLRLDRGEGRGFVAVVASTGTR